MNQWAECCGVPESEKVRFDKEDEELDQRVRERERERERGMRSKVMHRVWLYIKPKSFFLSISVLF